MECSKEEDGQPIVNFGDYTISQRTAIDRKVTYTKTRHTGPGRTTTTVGHSYEEIKSLMECHDTPENVRACLVWLDLVA